MNKRRYPTCRLESYIHPEICIGQKVTIKKNVSLSDKIKRIGTGTYIGDYTTIMNCRHIGNYCSISHGVKIGLENHTFDALSTSPLIAPMNKETTGTIIENDVLISANSLIMAGVRLGTGCVIGAGSFVNKDVPPYAIVAGTPARIIRFRFDEGTIKEILESKWWELDYSEIIKLDFKNPSRAFRKSH